MEKISSTSVREYIAAYPKHIQKLLTQIRSAIKKAAPGAEETISYGIPTFRLNGNLVHFAAFRNHIGFYPAPSGVNAFQKELSAYKRAKGSVQFPLDQALPISLIARIVRFRVRENRQKAAKRSKRKEQKS